MLDHSIRLVILRLAIEDLVGNELPRVNRAQAQSLASLDVAKPIIADDQRFARR